MNADLRELYQEVILNHSKHPRNFGTIDDATGVSEGYNPLCGDNVRVSVRKNGEKIEEVRFEGSGCAISTASASLMTMAMQGKSVDEAAHLLDDFQTLITSGVTPARFEDSDISALAGVHEYPVRIKCATLAWHAMRAVLDGVPSASTE